MYSMISTSIMLNAFDSSPIAGILIVDLENFYFTLQISSLHSSLCTTIIDSSCQYVVLLNSVSA